MSIEGKLALRIGWNGRQVTGTRIRSTRPAYASAILEGKLARDARALVPRLYSVCGKAQEAAASLACDFAAGAEPPAAVAVWRECRVIGECAQEYVWRLLLDLPPLLGEAEQPQEFAALRRRIGRLNADERLLCTGNGAQMSDWLTLADEVERFVAGGMLSMPTDEWARCSLDDWLAEGSTGTARMIAKLIAEPLCRNEVAPLPWLAADELKAGIAPALAAAEKFTSAPTWRGQPAETGAWVRQRAHPRLRDVSHRGVAVRLLARLIELADFPARLRALAAGELYSAWVRGAQVAPGVGIAAVETARGTLVHCVALDGEKVARWRIVAPTEWNFHPAGAFAQGLAGTEARSEADVRRAAALLAHALDPCVGFEIAVDHA
jgi:coenzyme F420-reducing hydrogenase alpha subunit